MILPITPVSVFIPGQGVVSIQQVDIVVHANVTYSLQNVNGGVTTTIDQSGFEMAINPNLNTTAILKGILTGMGLTPS